MTSSSSIAIKISNTGTISIIRLIHLSIVNRISIISRILNLRSWLLVLRSGNNISINNGSGNSSNISHLIFIASLILSISSSTKEILLISARGSDNNISSSASITVELLNKSNRGRLILILVAVSTDSSIGNLISITNRSKYRGLIII